MTTKNAFHSSSFKLSKATIIIPILGIILYVSPYIIMGENSTITIHDTLDEVVWTSGLVLGQNQSYLSKPGDEKIPMIMNGLPRLSLSSELNLFIQLFRFFKPYDVYVINQFLIRIIAFFGMFLLTKSQLIRQQNTTTFLINIGTSLCFSFLPFWANAGASVACAPLVLFSFLNIRNGRYNFYNWIILISIPFYSSLVYFGFFLIVIFSVIIFHDIIKRKAVDKYLFIYIFIISIIYLIIEHRLLYNTFINSDFLSHRTEFINSYDLNFYGLIYSTLKLFLFGHYHANPLSSPFLAISAIFPVVIIFKFFFHSKLSKECYMILLIILFMFFFSFIHGLTYIKIFNNMIKEANLSLLTNFQYDRMYFLFPALWHIVFTLSLYEILKYSNKFRLFIFVLILGQLLLTIKNHELLVNIGKPSFKQFFKSKEFNEVANYINLPKNEYKVASIGFHPSVSIYNGFHTIDGYITNYPLEYKNDFRVIIEEELNKNEKLKTYFDGWGSRCYLFSNEVFLDSNIKIIEDLQLNSSQLQNLGAKYIFSSAKIINPGKSGLSFENTFLSEVPNNDIYLYKVDYLE